MNLRNRANQLVDRAQLASRMAGPTNIRTDVTFSATGKDGSLQSGTYTRIRSEEGALRQEVTFGDYHAARIQKEIQVDDQGPWSDPPLAVRILHGFVPYSPIRFDPTDVIQSIEESSIAGQPASCIQFVTVRGEDRNPGDVCVSQANGTVLEWHDRDRSWEAFDYARVNGALLPSHFTYREGNTFSLTADVKLTMLETKPDAALTAPADWTHGNFCKTFQWPVPIATTQPPAKGGPDAPVTTVQVHAHVTAQGTITGAEVLKPNRAELDAEAIKRVSAWTYQPGSCQGHVQDFPIDVDVEFQGW